MNLHPQPSPCPCRQGFVLIAVLVFIFLLSMVTLSLLFRSRGDETAGHALAGAEQAWSAALSGIEEAKRIAAAATPGSSDWQDDPSVFRARPVYEDGADRWYFTVFSPADSEALVEVRYGLSDEAGRLNLNHPGEADLGKLPGITPTLATTLRQFLGQELKSTNAPLSEPPPTEVPDEPLPALDPAGTNITLAITSSEVSYHGPLATLDELLLMPGITRAMLHGALARPEELVDPMASETNAANVSSVNSPPSTDGPQFPVEFSQPKRSRGLDQYFTVYSREPNLSSAGQPRCNLNDPEAPLPAVDLPAGFSNYLATARAAKVHFNHPSELLEATVRGPDSNGAEVETASGFTKENLPLLLDLFATDSEESHEGLVNVNTASAAVLATLPGIDLPLAESIVSARTGLSPERRATLAWLYQEGVVDAAKFKLIAPSLTARSRQFRFNVIGYGLPSGRYRVLEVVIDTSATDPRILYLRDVTRLGLPFRLKEQNPNQPEETDSPFEAAGRNVFLHANG